MAKGKRYDDAAKRFDREQLHPPNEAVDLVKKLASAKFDETIELAVRLGVDPRKADQMVRGTVALPSGTGKDVRVAVFAAGEAAAEARAAGADIVGADDLAAEVEGGMLDFDVAIATPDLMPQVGQLGRVLGPRGLMPNPKTGTVTTDVGKAVGDFKGGKVEYRTDRYGNVHVPVGKVSFPIEALLTNFGAVLDELQRAKPASAKGRYLRHIAVSSTMGPGVKVDPPTRDPRTPRPLTEREGRARGQRRRAGGGRPSAVLEPIRPPRAGHRPGVGRSQREADARRRARASSCSVRASRCWRSPGRASW